MGIEFGGAAPRRRASRRAARLFGLMSEQFDQLGSMEKLELMNAFEKGRKFEGLSEELQAAFEQVDEQLG